jgi:outer membrane receptor protein involved in Fe transport
MTPNPNLDVETSNQVEVGIQKRAQKNADNFWNRTSLKAALFTINYKNFIEYNASGSPFSYLNSGNVDTQGLELSFEHDVSIYNFYLAYSFLDTEIKDQNRAVVGTPKHQLYLLTTAMLGPVVFELHNTYWSPYRADSGSSNKENDWVVTDFLVRTEGLNDWFLKAGIMNIADTQRVFTRFGSDFYPEPGRQYFIMLERYF